MHKEHDFNLLKVLVMIYQYRSLTIVAAHLGKTESAVSKHLSKLREQLKDPLFVRTTEGFEPTHYLERIIPGIEQGLKSVEQALLHGEEFDAENYDQPIKLALYNVSLEHLGEPLYREIRQAFPKAMIELSTWRDSTYQDLSSGKVHLGVQIFNEDCPKSIYQTNLFHIEMGALVGRQSSIQTWLDVFEHPSIFFEVRGWNDIHQRLIKLMTQNNFNLDYQLKLDNLTATYQILRSHNYSALLAKHLVSGSEFRFIPFPENMQPHTPLVACMKQSNRQSPLHMMLHQIIKKVLVTSS
ncbi:LysR family transcriptional regulator [Vibrio sp. ZSDZ65]|uniref:LysR family transcriptional regulator n=1 Tax=Vibrio qingdaonensis TaxID=2829491 RepID=A0A9X3CLQ1_9VIBR|nr:LysR family transcriptional regulator [Vibrio qingdaonensis]MCW8345722.1 LysR family transcriptional regulator [Vibrio qingdaonensis]